MNVPSNLISDSTLVQETLDLLRSRDGRATFIDIVDSIFRLSHVEGDLALALVSDLVRNDPRFKIAGDELTISEDPNDLRRLNDIDFVVLDIEAIVSRKLPARIIELGAHRIQRGEIVDKYQTLVNPGIPLPRFITSLTGITDEMLKPAPAFGEVAAAWLEFAGNAVLVAHNSMFDLSLLNREIARAWPGHRMSNAELCTVKLARRLLPNLEGHNLGALADHFGFEIPDRHRAAGDALATARIFLKLLDQLEECGVRTLAELRTFEPNLESDDADLSDLQLALDV